MMRCKQCSTPDSDIVHTEGQVHHLQARVAELEEKLEDHLSGVELDDTVDPCPKCQSQTLRCTGKQCGYYECVECDWHGDPR